MTYRIQIEEIKGDKLVKVYDKNVDRGLLKTGDIVGMFGYENTLDIMYDVEEFVENLAIKMTGIEHEEDLDDDKFLATVITECIIGINIAAMALGPISEARVIKDERKNLKLKQYAYDLLDKGKEIGSLCDSIKVGTMDDYSRKLGEQLMDELDDLNKRDD